MRARNLKPGFFKNEDLAECAPLARILYAGLWCMVDREGRMEFRPKRIKAEILPYDECSIDDLLNQLQRRGFILVYQITGLKFLSIPTFSKHQNPHVREAESAIPAPEEHSACTVQAPEEHGTSPAESLLLNPESLLLNPSCVPSGAQTIKDRFDRFWAVYPKRKSKGRAEQAFRKINPSEQLLVTMIAAIAQAKTTDEWLKENGKFIPYPASWLNAKGWEDEPTEIHPMSNIFSETSRRNVAVAKDWSPAP
ncbi:MAG: hypothetical protein KA099_13460 [Alphaproteobacteria bacterium]|nr:hypothetical protein [Alphaproteobacteria bacterium]